MLPYIFGIQVVSTLLLIQCCCSSVESRGMGSCHWKGAAFTRQSLPQQFSLLCVIKPSKSTTYQMKEKPEKLVACSFPLFLSILSMTSHLRHLELTPRKLSETLSVSPSEQCGGWWLPLLAQCHGFLGCALLKKPAWSNLKYDFCFYVHKGGSLSCSVIYYMLIWKSGPL